jgi:hypothetical protein
MHPLSSAHRTIPQRPGPPWQSRQAIIFRVAALFDNDPRLEMPPRLQRYIWRFVDHAMPDGPAFFLTFLIVFLLILNGFMVFLR